MKKAKKLDAWKKRMSKADKVKKSKKTDNKYPIQETKFIIIEFKRVPTDLENVKKYSDFKQIEEDLLSLSRKEITDVCDFQTIRRIGTVNEKNEIKIC